MTHAYNPRGAWNNRHLMAVNGKFAEISRQDLLTTADRFGIGTAPMVLEQVGNAVSVWQEFAEKAGLGRDEMDRIRKNHRIL